MELAQMTCYNVAGTVIGFSPTLSPIEAIIEANFRLCPKTEQPPDLRISGSIVDKHDFFDALPKWLAPLTKNALTDMEPVMLVAQEGIAVIVRKPESMSCAWVSQDMDELHFVGSRYKEMPSPMVVQPLIAPLLRDIKIQSDQVLLHAAVTCFNESTGILVTAPGYGGKTTTTMSLVRLGAKLLGDDLVALTQNEAGIKALGIPEPLNLTLETMDFFEECRRFMDRIEPNASENKTPISPVEIYGSGCLIDQCRLHIAYFVKIDGSGPAVRRLGTKEALERFAAAHMFVRKQSIPPRNADRLLDLVANIKAYELLSGPDPCRIGPLDHIKS